MPYATKPRLHLDFETASDLNLKKTGAYRYAQHPSTRVLMLGWAFNDEPVQLWEPHMGPMPDRLTQGLRAGDYNKHAFNAAFERLITKYVLGIEVPIDQWRCSMVESFYLAFGGGLDKVLEAIGLRRKDPRGGQLINMFCTPAPKNHKAEWYDWTNRPNEWDEFRQYCITDVEVERDLWHWMQRYPVMSEWDWKQWFVDQAINDRGVPMDTDMAYSALRIWDKEKAQLTAELQEMTGLPKVTRGPFLQWIEDNTGVVLEGTRKDYLAAMLKKGELPEEVRPFLEIWAQKEGKAASKYSAVTEVSRESDGRAGGMFQYKGASRTDRAGGRLIQLQNLKRPFAHTNEIDTLVKAIKTEDPGLLKLLYPMSVSGVLGGSIRHVIEAKVGYTFAICDLTSVESVILGWLTYCPSIDETFRTGRDSYKTFASKYHGIAYDDVTKEQRSFAKPAVLGCGFLLGWKGLIAYAEGYGVEMTAEQAKLAVNTFRTMYPEIPAFWKWIYEAVMYVTETGKQVSGYRLTIERDVDFLRIWLPSGRAISYYKPEVRRKEMPWSTPEKPAFGNNFCYMGLNDSNQWVRIFAHAGGVTENIVQSIAGDLLWSGIMNATAADLPVVIHVHDEIAVEVPEWSATESLTILQECMTRPPAWSDGMWIGAAGFTTKRYTKD